MIIKKSYSMKKVRIIGVVLLLLSVNMFASTVDTISVFSNSMNKKIKAVVILPENYNQGNNFSVVYLLHGHGDNYSGWIKKVPKIKKLADHYNFIIVMPDAEISWYWDSPVNKKLKYETFTSTELIKYIDSKYKTKKDRKARAITGLSMGGQGALFLAFRHQDIFGAAGSMSGGLDIRPFPLNWGLNEKLGSFDENKKRRNDFAVINQIYGLTPNSIQLIIDCGVSDFFHQVNANMHQKLLERNIPHVYIERPGSHSWDVWNDAVEYQFVFFNNYFLKNK